MTMELPAHLKHRQAHPNVISDCSKESERETACGGNMNLLNEVGEVFGENNNRF